MPGLVSHYCTSSGFQFGFENTEEPAKNDDEVQEKPTPTGLKIGRFGKIPKVSKAKVAVNIARRPKQASKKGKGSGQRPGKFGKSKRPNTSSTKRPVKRGSKGPGRSKAGKRKRSRKTRDLRARPDPIGKKVEDQSDNFESPNFKKLISQPVVEKSDNKSKGSSLGQCFITRNQYFFVV